MSWIDFLRNLTATESKEHHAGSVVMMESGQAVYNPKNYVAYAEEGYGSNPYLYASISEIARSVAGLSWIVVQRNPDGSMQEITDPNNLAVAMLERPNPDQSGQRFIEAAISYYLLSGNCFIEKVGPDGGVPRELWLLRPDRMKVITGSNGNFVGGYQYTVNNKTIDLSAESVVHIKTWNPLSEHTGCSPVSSAAASVDSNNQARSWNFNLLKNNAKVTFALSTDGELTDQQRMRIKEEFADKWSGASNAGKPKVFEGGLKPTTALSQSPSDMDWSEGIKLSGKEIAIAMGVPPEVIGDGQNRSYSSYTEARKSFYMETVIPIAEIFVQEFNNWLLPHLGNQIYWKIDKDQVDALQEDRTELWTRTMGAVTAGVISPNEARDLLGFQSVQDGDGLAQPFQVAVADDKSLLQLKAAPEDQEEKVIRRCKPDERDPDRPDSEQVWCVLTEDEEGVLGRHQTWGEAVRHLEAIEVGRFFDAEKEHTRVMQWKEMDRARDIAVEASEETFEKRMVDELNDIIKMMRKAVSPDELEMMVDIALSDGDEAWKKTMLGVYLGVGEGFAQGVFDRIKSQAGPKQVKADDDLISSWEEKITQYVEANIGKKITDINRTTREKIMKRIQFYLKSGMDWVDVADSIQFDLNSGSEWGESVTRKRARTIARTEIINASNASSQMAAQSMEMPLTKEWLGTPDRRARPWHRDFHKKIDLNVAYTLPRPTKGGIFQGTDNLMWPGDTSLKASAVQVVNCRCTEIYDVLEDED